MVIRDGKALLIQRGHNPGKGSWQIPGGYVEADETVADAVVRECFEEAGITAEVVDVLGFRHSVGGNGSIGGPSTNIYVVFRLRPIAGEPAADGDETAAAGYFSLEEIEGMDRVQSLSRWAIQRALNSGAGFSTAYTAADPSRPGWTLYGVTLPDGVEPVSVAVPARPPAALVRPPARAGPVDQDRRAPDWSGSAGLHRSHPLRWPVALAQGAVDLAQQPQQLVALLRRQAVELGGDDGLVLR